MVPLGPLSTLGALLRLTDIFIASATGTLFVRYPGVGAHIAVLGSGRCIVKVSPALT